MDLVTIIKMPIFVFVVFILPASVRRIATTTLGILRQTYKFRIKGDLILLYI